MSPSNFAEESILKEVYHVLRRTHVLTEEQKETLSKVFQKRLTQALVLIEAGKVAKYCFRPSGRTIWVVKGRKGDYQIMPDSMFCTCDDYYFRVMDKKKQLCYHLVAQQIAEALGKFGESNLADSKFAEVSSKWNATMSSGRS